MTSRAITVTGLLLILAVLLQTPASAAEQECDRWLKLVDHEVGERREALGKKAGAARTKIEEALARTSGRVAEARAACRAGKDKTATLMAMELWGAFVEEERQEGALSLNSRLTVLALRIDRLKAFYRRGWKPVLSSDEERQFLAEIDRIDRVFAETLKRALR
jgi:hypothetical protein